jgi:hypothetical protein
MLQGVRFAQVEAMPICGRLKSASVKPTARNIARDGDCFGPSTTSFDQRRGSTTGFDALARPVPALPFDDFTFAIRNYLGID